MLTYRKNKNGKEPIGSTSKKGKKSPISSESFSETPSGPESPSGTSEETQQITQAMATSIFLRGASTLSGNTTVRADFTKPPSHTGKRKKVRVARSSRVEGERMKSVPRFRSITNSTEKIGGTKTKSSSSGANARKFKQKKRVKNPHLQTNSATGAFCISSLIKPLSDVNLQSSKSLKALNLSAGSHHDDSNISEYSQYETSDSPNEYL